MRRVIAGEEVHMTMASAHSFYRLSVRLRALGEKAKAMAGPRAREMTRDEIDELSGS